MTIDAAAPIVAPVIAIDGLSYGYGDRVLFRNFSLEVAQGAHRLLLGASGSGKTTLINLITGLASPAEGRILIQGEPMSGYDGARRDDLRRRRIGIVFQTLRLVSALSVRANLRLAQRLAGMAVDDAAIDRILGEVGLGHRADAKPRLLSQGEMQRGAIARALVAKPAILIADEPTSALDDANADRIARLLLETADRNGSTLLVATHDGRLKRHIAETILLATPEGTA